MKLRLKGDSIRFRLTQSEVAALASGVVVRERTQFGPDSVLAYSVHANTKAADVNVTFAGGEITLNVPIETARQWAGTSQVSIDSEQQIERDRTIRVIIEKDFACLKPRAPGDDEDAFPNPAACEK